MTSTVDTICTEVYLCAAVAIPLVALLAAARDLRALLGALGDLRTAPVVLFAEIHDCACDSITFIIQVTHTRVVLHTSGVHRTSRCAHWNHH